MTAYHATMFHRIPRMADRMLRKGAFQRALEYAHMLMLRGMNMEGGSDVKDSGEARAAAFVARLTGGGPRTIFDVGANHGQYATLLSQNFGAGDRIECFEPSAAARAEFATKVFDGDARITLHPFGLSDDDRQMTLHASTAGDGTASVHADAGRVWGEGYDAKEQVNLQRLDAFCADEKIDHIHLLKLDVEGHELAVLRGGKAMIDAGKVDAIQFEMGPANIGSRTFFLDFWEFLSKDHVIFRIIPRGLVRIDDYKTAREVFLTTNYLALSRRIMGDGPRIVPT